MAAHTPPVVNLDLKYRSGAFREGRSRAIPVYMGNQQNMRQILHLAVDEFCDSVAFPEQKNPPRGVDVEVTYDGTRIPD